MRQRCWSPSDRVESTSASSSAERCKASGSIERLMLDKMRGNLVAYAIIKTGGVLSTHPPPVPSDPPGTALLIRAAGLRGRSDAGGSARPGPYEFDGDEFDWGDRSQSAMRTGYSQANGWSGRGRVSPAGPRDARAR